MSKPSRKRKEIFKKQSNTRTLLLDVILRDGLYCHICGLETQPVNTIKQYGRSQLAPTADHFVPRSHGGGEFIENIRVAHKYCNEFRGTRIITEDLRQTCREKISAMLAKNTAFQLD